MRKIIFILIFVQFHSALNAQWIFQHGYGDIRNERCQSAFQTSDGGFILNGLTTSYGIGDVDALTIKVNQQGSIVWAKSCGSAKNEIPTYAANTYNSNIIIIGTYDTASPGTYTDALLYKTDSTGNFLWAKKFGGINNETATKIIELPDHGYAITGTTDSYGAGQSDIYFIRTDENGDTIFTRQYGTSEYESSKSFSTTSDGGYIICGKSSSIIGTALVFKCFLMKIDSSGNFMWAQNYGDSLFQEAQSVVQTDDGGYIVCGSRDFGNSGDYDILLFKTDATGIVQWSKTYGGNKGEASYAVHLLEDNSYVLSGYTNSMGYGHRGNDSTNIFLMKTDEFGDTIWTRAYGDSLQEEAFLSAKTSDGGFILSGFSDYHNSDSSQAFVIKTDEYGFSGCYDFTAHPFVATNPLSNNSIVYSQSGGMDMSTLTLVSTSRLVPDSIYCIFTDVNEIEKSNSFILFPNPASEKIFVNGNFSGVLKINVYNLIGEEINIATLFDPQGNSLEINVASLMQGIYLLEIMTEKERVVRRFVKD